MPLRSRHLTTSLVLPLTLACGGPGGTGSPIGALAPAIFGIDTANTLIVFRATRPDLVTRTVGVAGLQAGERILGIDFRPIDGRLYALGSSSRVYTLDTLSGAATVVGTGAFTPQLIGTAFGFDFNPVADRIRAVSDSGQNLRLHPVLGTVVGVDSTLAYAVGDPNAGVAVHAAAAAYTNSVPGAGSTTLYAIDAGLGTLAALPDPNDGRLTTVADLAVGTSGRAGFDISGATGFAYVTLTPGVGASRFYVMNLGTGSLTLIGTVGHSVPLAGISVHP